MEEKQEEEGEPLLLIVLLIALSKIEIFVLKIGKRRWNVDLIFCSNSRQISRVGAQASKVNIGGGLLQ